MPTRLEVRRLALRGLALLVLLTCGSHSLRQPLRLEAGYSQDLKLTPGETRQFKVDLEEGDLLHLVVDQRGLDVELLADGEVFDIPLGAWVQEELRIVAKRRRRIVVGIRSFEKGAESSRGTIHLLVAALKVASPEDIAASRDFESFHRALGRLETPAAKKQLEKLAFSAYSARQRALAAALLSATLNGKKSAEAAALGLQALAGNVDPPLEAVLTYLRGRGLTYGGSPDQARAYLKQSIEISGRFHDFETMARAEAMLGFLDWQNNHSLGNIYHREAARRLFKKAGRESFETQEELELARALMRRANSPEPLAILLEALTRPNLDRKRQAELLREIGWWLLLSNRANDAQQLLAKAVEIDGSDGNLPRLAMVEIELGHFATAKQLLLQVDARNPDRRSQSAEFEAGFCHAERGLGNLAGARAHCSNALKVLEHAGIRGARAVIKAFLASIEQAAGDLVKAELLAQQAAEEIEEQRRHVGGSLDRMAYFSVRTSSPSLLVDLRLALQKKFPGQGWSRRALEANELTRARALFDLLALERGKAQGWPDAADRRRELELTRKLEIFNRGLLNALLEGQPPDPVQGAKLRVPREELALLRLSQNVDSAPEPRLEPAFEPAGFEEITGQLETSTILLVFHLGPEHAFGWAISRKGIRGADLGESDPIRDLALAVHQQLMSSQSLGSEDDLLRWLAELASRLFEPFAAELHSSKQVVIVATPELQRIPFGALPFPAARNEPLIVSRAVAILPSAAVFPKLRKLSQTRRPNRRLMAIVDDPVYDADSRLPVASRRPGPFPRLLDTALEGEELLAMAKGLGGSQRITGFAANRDHLLQGGLTGYRLLHFAVHARTTQAPRGLILSRFEPSGRRIEDLFGFDELYSLSLDADLAVISACSSGLGQEVAGEGLLGLSQGFMQAGVPRLMLTLWPVGGKSTRQLIAAFYRQLLQKGQPPAEALRIAQLDMFRDKIPLRDWAAFELVGDWSPISELSAKNLSSAINK